MNAQPPYLHDAASLTLEGENAQLRAEVARLTRERDERRPADRHGGRAAGDARPPEQGGGTGVSDSVQLALLKRIRDQLNLEYRHRQGWETQVWMTRGANEAPSAGWIFDVREGDGWRTLRIEVTNLGFVGDAESEAPDGSVGG